ncbi:TMEM43 family protein [Patescibacteria group bacterium]|nr:TMEM43 family protein [Patescibacteria group bacterium]MBU1673580.1 TMEM43 family protein [Patescibacteria group bacterium]MBU1963482.1 TMEM43 family protein [Patescibacteria group bacterium]
MDKKITEKIDREGMEKTCDDLERKFEGKKCTVSPGMLMISVLLFIGAFTMLYSSESRLNYRSNTAGTENVAETAHEIPADEINTIIWYEGKLVSVSGTMESEKKFGGEYLRPDDFIVLQRTAEMYSYDSNGETSWQEFPPDIPENPKKSIDNYIKYAKDAHVGVYTIDVEHAWMPSLEDYPLNEDNAILGKNMALKDGYIYQGQQSVNNPEIGDMRLNYQGIEEGKMVTVFGKLNYDHIVSYEDDTVETYNQLFRVYNGTRQEALRTMKTENLAYVWTFRILSFILIWIGVYLFLNPMAQIVSKRIKPDVLRWATYGGSAILSAIFVIIPILLTRWLEYYIALLVIGFIVIAVFIMGIRYMVKYDIIKKGIKVKKGKYQSLSVYMGDDDIRIDIDKPEETIDDNEPISKEYCYELFKKKDDESFIYHNIDGLEQKYLNMVDDNLVLPDSFDFSKDKGVIKWQVDKLNDIKKEIGLADYSELPANVKNSISNLLFG